MTNGQFKTMRLRLSQKMLLFIILQGVISCNSITEIGSSTVGSRLGINEKLIIKPDSIKYEITYASRFKPDVFFSEVNTRWEWKKFKNSIDLDLFKKVENGKTNQVFDGTDIITYVKTKNKTYSFTNGYSDTVNYKAVQKLMNDIDLKLIYFRKKSS